MSVDGSSSEDRWLQYISKLNDREINRKRSSGFTTWAVCGLIGLLFYNILDRIDIIFTPATRWLLLLAQASVFNIGCSIVLFVMMLLFQGITIPDIRLSSRIDRAAKPIIFVPLMTLTLLLSIINVYVGYVTIIRGVSNWIYYVFGGYYLIQVIIPAIQKIYTAYKLKKAYKDMPIPDSLPALLDKKIRFISQIIFTVLATTMLLFSALSAYQILVHTNIASNINVIKFSIEVCVLAFAVLYLFIRLSRSFRNKFLERLERMIVMEDLKTKNIVSVFTREYLGETISDWLGKIEDRIKKLYDNFVEESKNTKNEMGEIDKIDPKYTIEIDGRIKKVCESHRKSFHEYADYMKVVLRQMSHLAEQKAFYSDKDLVDKINDSWNMQLEEAKRIFDEVCGICKSIQNKIKGQKEKCDAS